DDQPSVQTFKRSTSSNSVGQMVNTSPMGRTSTTTLDARGRALLVESPGLAPLTYTYDSRGRVVKTSQSDGTETRTTTFEYDAAGQVSKISDALGRDISLTYDPRLRPTAITRPDGETVRTNYNQLD